ncbi:MAG TPA: ion channel [Nitrospira sp.]|nr:ion channel [Nitrospira sp.]
MWWRRYLPHRYAVLFYSLILTLLMGPFLKTIGVPNNFVQLFLGVNLVAATVPLERGRGRWALRAIVLVAIVLRIVSLLTAHAELATIILFLWTAIGLYAVFIALRFALRSSVITSEHLYAALSAYLLAGVFMGVLYWSVDQVWPGSIIVNGPGASNPFIVAEGIYFSFITLATVGYGDMVPGNEVVRGLAVVEAIAGQFYLAVMVARLMSLYISEKR